MGIGPCAKGRVKPTAQPLHRPQHCPASFAWQQRSWLACPLQEGGLRHRSREALWGRASPEASSPAAQRPILKESDRTRAPADLFQSALSALDLFHPAAAIISESIDDPDDIAVEQGQTAASVGRAIYEVSPCLNLSIPNVHQMLSYSKQPAQSSVNTNTAQT